MNTKRGGKRENSGRKKVSDKKKQVCFYFNSTEIEKMGGLEKLREKIGNLKNDRFMIDFFELSFLAEACIPPVPIARSMFWDKMIDSFYGQLKVQERVGIFEWMYRSSRFENALKNNEEKAQMFFDRYNPENQFLVDATHNGNDLQVECFLHNNRYHTSSRTSIADECITKVTKIEIK